MKKIYNPFYKWEDFNNGFFNNRKEEEYILKALELLSSPQLFEEVGVKMIDQWTFCIDENLTNSNLNKIAYLGQASCNFKYGCTSLEVKEAWKKLETEQKNKANNVAKKLITYYNEKYNRVYRKMGKTLL